MTMRLKFLMSMTLIIGCSLSGLPAWAQRAGQSVSVQYVIVTGGSSW
jgi:hypothetical protein